MLVVLFSFSAHAAEGLYILGADTLHLARADGGTASPRSAYWALLNPASLTDLDKRLDISLYAVWDRIMLNPSGLLANTLDGSLRSTKTIFSPLGGMVWPLADGEKGTLGFGMYPIAGGAVELEESRSILGKWLGGNTDRRLGLQTVELVLAYAYEFDNGWALGAGIQPSLTRFHTDQITLKLRPTEGNNEWDCALGIGFNLGVYKSWEKFSVGASFKSRQWNEGFDKYKDLITDSLDYPHTARVGVAWRPIERVELNLDYEYQYWTGVPPAKGTMMECGLEWDDCHAIKAGLEVKATQRLTLMGGYSFSTGVVDDDHVFLNVLSPSIIEHHVTAGFSFAITPRHLIHAAYAHGVENSLRDSGHGDLFSRFTGGSELRMSGDAVSLGYTYLFGLGKS